MPTIIGTLPTIIVGTQDDFISIDPSESVKVSRQPPRLPPSMSLTFTLGAEATAMINSMKVDAVRPSFVLTYKSHPKRRRHASGGMRPMRRIRRLFSNASIMDNGGGSFTIFSLRRNMLR